MRQFAVLSLLVLLAGCATLGLRSPVPEAERAGMQNIGVSALLGERHHAILVGVTSIGNRYYAVDAAAWDIDGLATSAAVASLSAAGAWRVAPLERQGRAAETFYRDGDYRTPDRDALLALAAAQGLDTLVLVLPTADDTYPDRAGGYGYQAAFGIGGVSGCPYVQFVVEVVRVADGRRLGWDRVRDCDDAADPGWRPAADEYTAAEWAMLRESLEDQVRRGVTSALRWLEMTGPASATREGQDSPPPGLFRRD
ncbi:MAG: hypothetical protein EA371_11360 [Gammaproteobacteria bacterium]|nr:MAG: hypothetical protein EA371_11360 [Gammaproteobacteria bacterium]